MCVTLVLMKLYQNDIAFYFMFMFYVQYQPKTYISASLDF